MKAFQLLLRVNNPMYIIQQRGREGSGGVELRRDLFERLVDVIMSLAGGLESGHCSGNELGGQVKEQLGPKSSAFFFSLARDSAIVVTRISGTHRQPAMTHQKLPCPSPVRDPQLTRK
jgi:hypothetical protein